NPLVPTRAKNSLDHRPRSGVVIRKRLLGTKTTRVAINSRSPGSSGPDISTARVVVRATAGTAATPRFRVEIVVPRRPPTVIGRLDVFSMSTTSTRTLRGQ